ncbi:MAG: pitrilysin family protein [bacterium]|nr:pitrilysin family protein [bacterium]
MSKGLQFVSRLLLLTLLTISVTGGLGALAQEMPALAVTEYTLENGLEVILVEDRSAPTVVVNVTYQVGGANDPAGRSGFAHLFEHLMFEETAHLETGELDNLVETVGGYLNAYTAIERTVYYTALPAHQLPLALWYEADRLASLVVSQDNFENQRAVVIEEYQERVSNSPYGEAIQDLFTLPYTFAPYRQRPIGSVADLNAATIDDVIAFHATYYVPNNATLVVAGDIDVESTRSLIDEFFADIPAQAEPPALTSDTAGESIANRVNIGDPLANISAILIGYPVPPRSDADFAALEVATRILGYGASSRMAQALLDTGLALDTGVFTDGNREESLVATYAFANMGVTLDEIEAVYQDVLAQIIADGPTADELDKAINQIRSERIVSLETVEGLAEAVQVANFYFDDPQAVFGEIDRFADVTVADVQRVVSEYLTAENAVVILVEPGEASTAADTSAEATAAAEANVNAATSAPEPAFVIAQAEPPEPLPIREFVLPEIRETTLENGLTVIVIPRPEVPIISVDVYMPGGESAVAPELAGVAGMTADLLTRGTENRTAQEIAAEIEQVGGVVGADATQDRLAAGVFALREDAELAFAILSDIVLNPTFPEAELEVSRQQFITSLQDVFANPDALAARTFTRLVYGDHPYGIVPTETSLTAIDRDAIAAYYADQANPARAFMIITGAITPEDGTALAEQYFSGWVWEGDDELAALPEPQTSTEPGIYLVDRPGSTQAQYVIGSLGISGSDERRDAARVLNTILGAGFTSRLMQVIREELGYTYGISSSFTYPVTQGTVSIATAVGNDVAAPALEAILEQVNLLRDETVPQSELDAKLSGLIGSEALRLETYQSLVDFVAALRLRGLPVSEISDRIVRLANVDVETIQTAAQTLIVPENLLIVVVGDADVLEAPLSAIAPVTVLEAE